VRVLLIGGSGFIGPHVCRALERTGHEVIVFHRGRSRSPGREILGDRRNLSAHTRELLELRADVVLDLVLSSGRQARALTRLFRGHVPRLVALSSCDVYRACGVLHRSEPGPLEPLPLTETSPLRTKSETYPPEQLAMLQKVFGWLDDEYDKISVEQEVLSVPDLPGTVLRLPMVYGPGDPLHRCAPVLRRIDAGRRAILFEEKAARWRAPRGYVENVAAAIALAAQNQRGSGRVYNVGERESVSEFEWAQRIAAAAGWKGTFVTVPAEHAPPHLQSPANFDQHWVVDTTRIRDELDYREPIAEDDALRQTIQWERTNPPPEASFPVNDEAEDDVLRKIVGRS